MKIIGAKQRVEVHLAGRSKSVGHLKDEHGQMEGLEARLAWKPSRRMVFFAGARLVAPFSFGGPPPRFVFFWGGWPIRAKANENPKLEPQKLAKTPDFKVRCNKIIRLKAGLSQAKAFIEPIKQ